jgi:hypothetical protein
METKLEQIAVKAVNQLPKSVVREIRTLRSVGTGGGRLPPVTRWREATRVPTATCALFDFGGSRFATLGRDRAARVRSRIPLRAV